MKKRILPLLLAVLLALSGLSVYAADSSAAEQTVKALGIIVGDDSGDMNLGANVTRAQFAKMMVAASTSKNAVGDAAGVSPFKDVKYTHWAAGYVKVAAGNGWVSGYLDGTFRPDNTITLGEAASAILGMLGYTSSDLVGAYPTAQVNKFKALGLMDGLTKTASDPLTRQDCVYIFYNLMSAQTQSGQTYGTTLGYTVTDSGVDYSSLVSSDTNGPLIVEDVATWKSEVPFTPSTVYRNGTVTDISAVKQYDVVYYNENMRTLWAYSTKVTGLYTAASPSTSSPSSVTVGGNTYTISSTTAAYQLSVMGEFSIGDTVTLLLGMDGGVAGVIPASSLTSEVRYGMVLSTGIQTYTDQMGGAQTVKQVTLLCADGSTQQYVYDTDNTDSSENLETGDMAMVTHTGAETIIKQIYNKGSGFSASSLTSDANIIDISSESGEYARIYPSRLSGKTLSASSVAYYAVNSNHKITDVILNDATGDIHTYALVTKATKTYTEDETTGSSTAVGSYTYLVDGETKTTSTSSTFYNISTGPVMIEYEDGAIDDMVNLSSENIISISGNTAKVASGTRTISDGAQVYIKDDDDTYYLTNLAAVNNLTKYSLSGYYDSGHTAGGYIRIIIARLK